MPSSGTRPETISDKLRRRADDLRRDAAALLQLEDAAACEALMECHAILSDCADQLDKEAVDELA